jgi:hypothetical protein
MEIVIIPFDFMTLSPDEQNRVVPICLTRNDAEGNKIAWGWFEAVAKIQMPLRLLADRVLKDIWRVSEVADLAVQSVWANHGTDFGRRPEGRIYSPATSYAQDLRVGTRRQRVGLTVALEGLDEFVRDSVLIDPADYDARYMAGIQLSQLTQRAQDAGRADVSYMLDLLRDGCNWEEIGRLTDKHPDTVRIHFRRWMQTLVEPQERRGDDAVQS